MRIKDSDKEDFARCNFCHKKTDTSIEYSKSGNMCFIDLEKAFERVQLKDVSYLLLQD